VDQLAENKASRKRFLRQAGLSLAAGVGGSAILSKSAMASTTGAHVSVGYAAINPNIPRPKPIRPDSLLCCPNNTNCVGTCPPGDLIFYCDCPGAPYCVCHEGTSCYLALC
jgi:hypothetical protein